MHDREFTGPSLRSDDVVAWSNQNRVVLTEKSARPGIVEGTDLGALVGLSQQADEGLHVFVVLWRFQSELYSHAKTWMHGLHDSLHAQFHILSAHYDLDAGAGGKG